MIILGYTITVLCALLCLGACVLRPECANRQPLYQPTFKLFGTKTSYNEATKYMDSKNPSDLPKTFSHKSLRQIHNELTSKSCAPVQLYFVGRHAARFPDFDDIIVLNNFHQKLSAKLQQLKNNSLCENDVKLREQLLSWRSPMRPNHDNLVTLIGEKEELNIAKRFESIYPKLLDPKLANITLGVTGKLRTTQTAVGFLQAIRSYNYPKCNSFPTNDLENPSYNIDAIVNNECYKALEEKHRLDFLDFHDQCKKIRRKSSTVSMKDQVEAKIPLVKKLDKPENIQFIADNVAKKLGLDEMSSQEVENIYDLCKYEHSIKGSSIWCTLLDDKQLIYLDYIEDVEDYFGDAYGMDIFASQSCPLLKDLVLSFEKTIKGNDEKGEENLNTYLYFTHAGALKKLYSAFQLFKDKKSYDEKTFEESMSTKSPPVDRQWRSSLTVPFSGNIAFHLYKCPDKKFKLLGSVAERPIKIGGCKHKVCDMDEFMEAYKSNLQCNLEQVCSLK